MSKADAIIPRLIPSSRAASLSRNCLKRCWRFANWKMELENRKLQNGQCVVYLGRQKCQKKILVNPSRVIGEEVRNVWEYSEVASWMPRI